MQIYSQAADGDLYTVVCFLIMGFGLTNDFIYLMITLILNLHFNNFLKSFLHHSRPQLDEPDLAIVNRGACAAEFGNPSGHALTGS